MTLLRGKTAVVTGGSDGIGLGIAQVFAGYAADLVLIGRDREKLETAKRQLTPTGVIIKTISADLSRPGDSGALAERVLAEVRQVDVLVNNAGTAQFLPLEQADETHLDRHIDLNIKTPYLLTRALLPALRASRGNIVNISSYFAERMLPERPSSAYSLTKGAIDSLTKALAFELGPDGIRVNAIAPGSVATPLLEANLERLDAEQRRRFNAMIKTIYPLGHIGEPRDVGEAAAYLASDHARWVSGSLLHVDGGLTTN